MEDSESFERTRLCGFEYYQTIFDELVTPTRTAAELFAAMTTGMPNLENCTWGYYGEHSIRWPAHSEFRTPSISRRFSAILQAAGIRTHITPPISICNPAFPQSARRAAHAYFQQLDIDLSSDIIDANCSERAEAITMMEAATTIPETSEFLTWLTDAIQSDDDINFMIDVVSPTSTELLVLYENPSNGAWIAAIRSGSGTSLLQIEPDADGRNSIGLIDFSPYL